MNDITGIHDVFAAYGEAACHAQLMEYDLFSIWMLDSVTQGVSLTKQDLLEFQGSWHKKTFGRLLRPLQKSNLISTEVKDFLEQLRVTRNYLAHDFFLDSSTDLQTIVGREKAASILQRMNTLIQKGQEFFANVLQTYLNDFGVDAETIRRQVFKKIKNAEQ